MKQDTTQATLFKLVYGRTATIPVEIEVNTYLTEPITEENFQETLLKRTYDLMETLKNKQRRAADNIQKSQEKQKKRHDSQLPNKPVEFKIRDKCDLIYNLLPRIIYTIPEEDKPINSCTSESELTFNLNSKSDNDNDENNSSSSASISNKIYNNSNFDSDPKTFIALSNLTKKQELKWFSNNSEDIMPEHTHDTDARFDLRYPGKDLLKLEPHLHTCIDLKIALKIPATTMVQLASRSNLAKKKINIRGGIIDTGYIENIITMLQNDSEKAYIIDLNEKIA
ncbi:hypothetical protein G9A89_010778 [Geosiphon pyriformis]|nr:hypothetical protein G9A89_010778 [Geosiphon pyriformis]